jgi:methylsterol monooxygenase/4-alpha-methyl-delta7-sterol-4alpha-methyl oxidase
MIEDLPSLYEICKQVFLCSLFEDAAFYWCHRTLHSKYLYARVHKIHHLHRNIVATASENAHPVEFLIGNVIPVILGPLILGNIVHEWSFLIWIFVRIGESHDTHSGYNFPWTPFRLLPFAVNSI